MAALVAALLCLPAAAQADPVTINKLTLTGDAVEGSTLQVGVDASPPIPPTTAAYQWQRCKPLPAGCGVIGGASGSSYTLTPDDVGWQIVAYVTLTNGPDTAGPTPTPVSDIVRAKPVPPPPPPPPPPTPTPIPPTVSTAASLPAGPAFLRPFPIVRIRGFFAKGGARITLLSVKGPKVARVQARCIGRGCPVRTLTMFPADGRLHRFERFLRAGIKLQIRVTRPGRIGSYTSFLIRSRKAPVRTDRCLSVKTSKPILCSAP